MDKFKTRSNLILMDGDAYLANIEIWKNARTLVEPNESALKNSTCRNIVECRSGDCV